MTWVNIERFYVCESNYNKIISFIQNFMKMFKKIFVMKTRIAFLKKCRRRLWTEAGQSS